MNAAIARALALATSALAVLTVSPFATSIALAAPAADTLLGPFTAGMTLEEIDTLASRSMMRWVGRDIRYAADSTLRLYEVRDTSIRGVLLYGLTLDRGRLQQVEALRLAPVEDSAAVGAWLAPLIDELVLAERSASDIPGAVAVCRETASGPLVHHIAIRGAGIASVVASIGNPRAGCLRC